jgi:phosphoribosylformimino-5-aminoimidazole carboxamide ribotide isomerase
MSQPTITVMVAFVPEPACYDHSVSLPSRRGGAVQVIPVVDLKGGLVVRARMGERANYRPIETALSPTSAPRDVVRGLLSIYPFALLYIADLDAIEASGNNDATVSELRGEFPRVELWVDRGIADRRAAEDWLATGLGHMVLGSESLADAAVAQHFADDPRVILSLDFRAAAFQGPPALLAQPDDWPTRVIVMTLARVGSGAGPDLERLGAIRAAAPTRKLYAAGGVRDVGDLVALQNAGIAGALVASSLHDGRLTWRQIESVDDVSG